MIDWQDGRSPEAGFLSDRSEPAIIKVKITSKIYNSLSLILTKV